MSNTSQTSLKHAVGWIVYGAHLQWFHDSWLNPWHYRPDWRVREARERLRDSLTLGGAS